MSANIITGVLIGLSGTTVMITAYILRRPINQRRRIIIFFGALLLLYGLLELFGVIDLGKH